jgi:phage portal protein BeeE
MVISRRDFPGAFFISETLPAVARRNDRKIMFGRFKSFFRLPESKSSRSARLIALENGGRARWTPRDYAALAREGYARNAIVYRAVRLIAESIGALSFVLYEGSDEHDTHPLLDLIKRPNPRQDGASLLESIASHLLLAGNAYVEAVGPGANDASTRTLCAAARSNETCARTRRLAAGL